MIVAIIAITGLIIAIVALSEAFIVIAEYHHSPASPSTPAPSPQTTLYPTTTPQPTVAPTATSNLSSAVRDNNQTITVNFTINYAFTPVGPAAGPYFTNVLNVTNVSKSNVAITTITYVANANTMYESNGTYYGSGYKVLSPNQTATFDWINPPMLNSITVYYQVANELFYHTINFSPPVA